MPYCIRYKQNWYYMESSTLLTAVLVFVIRYLTFDITTVDRYDASYSSVDFVNTKGSSSSTDCPF